MPGVDAEWCQLEPSPEGARQKNEPIPIWMCAAPIWVLPQYFGLLESHGVRSLVALSSTSALTKVDSSDANEQAMAHSLQAGESAVLAWAGRKNVRCVILRPTLIYGGGRDKNILEIARFIQRYGFFPLLGPGNGLRQPVHVEDVAHACAAALEDAREGAGIYHLSGGETLQYRDMVARIFLALGRVPRMFSLPFAAFRIIVLCARLHPRYRSWSPAMAQRMNTDLVFDHSAATRDFGFHPRAFHVQKKDMPK
jgi:nucleoside-diphosphate-sugar epimerase